MFISFTVECLDSFKLFHNFDGQFIYLGSNKLYRLDLNDKFLKFVLIYSFAFPCFSLVIYLLLKKLAFKISIPEKLDFVEKNDHKRKCTKAEVMETFDIYENLSMNQIFVVKCKGKIIYFKTILDKIKIRGKTRKK